MECAITWAAGAFTRELSRDGGRTEKVLRHTSMQRVSSPASPSPSTSPPASPTCCCVGLAYPGLHAFPRCQARHHQGTQRLLRGALRYRAEGHGGLRAHWQEAGMGLITGGGQVIVEGDCETEKVEEVIWERTKRRCSAYYLSLDDLRACVPFSSGGLRCIACSAAVRPRELPVSSSLSVCRGKPCLPLCG